MQHSVSNVKVYATTDYKRFVVLDGNRPINKKKVERIIKEIESGNDVLDEVPILVKESGSKLPVIDGQHRLEVSRRLKRPVHYIIRRQDMSLYNVAKVNSNVEKWKDTDYVNCYVKAGNDHYVKLQAFCKKYQISPGIGIILLHNGTMKGESDEGKRRETLRLEFEQGTWECRKQKEARLIMEQCKNFEAFPGWNSRAFIMAICVLMQKELCDFDRLVKKFLRDPRRLTSSGNYKDILVSLESIYNLDNQKRVAIH